MNEKHITINILPQDPFAWLFIAGAIVLSSFFWSMKGTTTANANDLEKARIEHNVKK